MKTSTRLALGIALAAAAVGASAHTGHGTESLFEGLAHPLGADHLLAMVAVGLWSAAALPAGRRVAGPLAFLAALLAGALAGTAGLAMPLVEPAIALSVVMLGAMLVAAQRLPASAGLVLVAAAGVLHGLAHGAELPAGGHFAAYAGGFLLATAALHGLGLALGRHLIGLHHRAWQLCGAAFGLSGLALLLGA